MNAKTYDSKSYELAEYFLDGEPYLNTEENCDELAKLIQTTVEDHIAWLADNYDPTPYCKYHGSKKNCDCGQIADNE